jgi:hypothetical protein
MKTQIALILSGLLMSCGSGLGQQPANPPPATRSVRAPVVQQQQTAESDNSLTRFALDFPGGTPRQLVEAIEKASGGPLNAIIPDENAALHLPPMKMRSVTVVELFEALQSASRKTLPYISGNYPDGSPQYGFSEAYYGFRTQGTPKSESVWSFFYNKPSIPLNPSACRFYQLAPYLETFKVEDITTAIQTGWKMLGETNPPTITYHKDTKLLIAVGEKDKLQLIENVLSQLSRVKAAPEKSGESAKPAGK